MNDRKRKIASYVAVPAFGILAFGALLSPSWLVAQTTTATETMVLNPTQDLPPVITLLNQSGNDRLIDSQSNLDSPGISQAETLDFSASQNEANSESGGASFECLGITIQFDADSETVDSESEDDDEDDFPIVEFGDFLGYNSVQDDTTWLIATGDDLGILSSQSYPTLNLSDSSSLVTGLGFHFLNGPIQTDLPPRLYDFQIAYHARPVLGERLVLDLKAGVGVFSDFEGSAREGVRNPGHAVGYMEIQPWIVAVGGLEVLDRDDFNLLPVGGLILRPLDNLVMELVYPRPRVLVNHRKNRAIYVSGELGGNTWAIERPTGQPGVNRNDVATYKDLRVQFGAISYGKKSDTSLELGWAFDRRLSYRSNDGNYQPEDAFFLQLRVHY